MKIEQPGPTTFTELSDTPNSYIGDASKVVKVDVGETGLEFGTGGGGAAWGAITGTLSAQTDLQTALDAKVDENVAITGATKTKVTYDSKGLVTSGADATTADIADSLDKRYVTDANLTVIGNTSGTNTGDNAVNSNYSGLVSNATHSGDATGATALSVVRIQGTAVPAPVAGDDQKFLQYNHGTTAFIYGTATGGSGLTQPQVMARLSIGF